MASLNKEKKRKIIREVATKLFAEKGFENTTTREISKAAKVSSSALYYYFDSKEELLYQILDETISTGLKLITKIDENEKDFRKKLSSVLRIHTASAVNFDKMKLLVHDQKSLSPDHMVAIKDKQRDYVRILITILESLKQQRKIKGIDPTACAFAFFGMVSWAYRWYNPKGRIKPRELSEIFSRIFTRGIFSD